MSAPSDQPETATDSASGAQIDLHPTPNWRTLPNYLTLGRVLLIVPFTAAFWLPAPAGWWVALALFLLASVTDFFDGWLARRSGQTSDFGRFLDPVADKLLVVAALVLLVAFGAVQQVHVVAVILILLREVSVSALREFLAARQIVVHVTSLAKWKTTTQLIAIAVLLAAGGLPAAWRIDIAGIVLLWLAAALTVWTGAEYFRGAARRPQ